MKTTQVEAGPYVVQIDHSRSRCRVRAWRLKPHLAMTLDVVARHGPMSTAAVCCYFDDLKHTAAIQRLRLLVESGWLTRERGARGYLWSVAK